MYSGVFLTRGGAAGWRAAIYWQTLPIICKSLPLLIIWSASVWNKRSQLRRGRKEKGGPHALPQQTSSRPSLLLSSLWSQCLRGSVGTYTYTPPNTSLMFPVGESCWGKKRLHQWGGVISQMFDLRKEVVFVKTSKKRRSTSVKAFIKKNLLSLYKHGQFINLRNGNWFWHVINPIRRAPASSLCDQTERNPPGIRILL